jgi:hypothetical protein
VGLYEYTADKVLQKLKALYVLGWEGGQVGVTVLCGLTIRESYFFIYRRPTLYPLEIAVDFLKSL